MATRKIPPTKAADSENKAEVARVPLTQYEAFGLFTLLTSTSKFAMDLAAKLRATGATVQMVNKYFLTTLSGTPFNLGGKLDVTKFQALWTDPFGNLALQLDQTPSHVGKALTPDIPYDSPPCPDATTQVNLWKRLTGT